MPPIDLGTAWADEIWEGGVWANGVWAGQEAVDAVEITPAARNALGPDSVFRHLGPDSITRHMGPD